MKTSIVSQVASVLAAAVATAVTFQSIATYALPAAPFELVAKAPTCRATAANATGAATLLPSAANAPCAGALR